MLRVEIGKQVACILRHALRRGRTGRRPFPETPLDARVIDPHARTDEHHDAGDRKQQPRQPGRPAEQRGGKRGDRDRNAVVIGIALQKAERAGNVAADMLEGERAAQAALVAIKQKMGR